MKRSTGFGFLCSLIAALFSVNSLAGTIVPDNVVLETFIDTGISAPIGVRHAGDGSGRLFIIERAGRIRIYDPDDGLQAQSFLDIASQVNSTGFETGFLGLAFHPEYAANGRFYVHYSAGGVSPFPNGDTVISEFQVSPGDPNLADGSSERVIVTISQDFNNHNGGDIHFGADDYLYIGMGDGGAGNDPCNRAQTLDPADRVTTGSCGSDESVTLLGKMLRLDVDTITPPGTNGLCGANGDGSAEYGIPDDNPFAGADSDNGCDEIWSFGLRNPYRFSFDRQTGDMFIGDVGQNAWEEIDFEPFTTPGGLNYGWDQCEASFISGTSTPCNLAGSILPIIEYPNPGGASAIGGYRYRGPVSSLNGLYIFADIGSGQVSFAQETSPGVWDDEIFQGLGGGIIAGFGEDEAGNVYVNLFTNEILVFAGNLDETFFVDGFESD